MDRTFKNFKNQNNSYSMLLNKTIPKILSSPNLDKQRKLNLYKWKPKKFQNYVEKDQTQPETLVTARNKHKKHLNLKSHSIKCKLEQRHKFLSMI